MLKSMSSPPYVMRRYGDWRVIIPVRGKLSPYVAGPRFKTELEAVTWLNSPEGQVVIAQSVGHKATVDV